jgi:hypothetical protein
MTVVALSPEYLLCISSQVDARMVELRIMCGCESIDGSHLAMVDSEVNARIPTDVKCCLQLGTRKLTMSHQILSVEVRIPELRQYIEGVVRATNVVEGGQSGN